LLRQWQSPADEIKRCLLADQIVSKVKAARDGKFRALADAAKCMPRRSILDKGKFELWGKDFAGKLVSLTTFDVL